jgi:hypothetical protein
MIDPQMQANKWLKKLSKDSDGGQEEKIIKTTDD